MAKEVKLPEKTIVPENWLWVELGKLSETKSGYPFDSGRFSQDDNKKRPLIRIRDVVRGYTETFTDEDCPEDYIIHRGEILIGMDGDFNLEKWANEDALLNQRVCTIKSNSPCLLDDFIYYHLPALLKAVNEATPSVTVKHLSTKTIAKLLFPVPPLPEQQRIVDRIESLFAKLDEAKEKAQAVVDGYEQRKAAILHQACTGELTKEWREKHNSSTEGLLEAIKLELLKEKKKSIKKVQNEIASAVLKSVPQDWVVIELDDLSKMITDGEHQTPSRVDQYCGFYLLSARNIHNDSLRLEDVDYVDEAEFLRISKRCNPKKGDVLISCSGSVGRCCVVNDENKYVMVRSAAVVSPVVCNSRFVMYAVISDFVQEQIKRLTKQTAQANLFIGAIASLKIPLPSFDEQNEIVVILDSLLNKEQQAKETAEAVIDQIEQMKKSILARAFRGELGTNDPAEESAEKLLKQTC